MNKIKIFNNPEFGQVRTIEKDGEPWFVANEIATILGYANPSDATNSHCKNSILWWGSDSLGRQQRFKIIPESDLYRLIIRSKLPIAEKFERWVMEEVLPSIRKHGLYSVDDLLDNPDLAIKAFEALKEEREKNKLLQQDNERMKPKEIFADAVSTSQTSILIGDLAKILKQNGIETGQKRLFTWLRDNGYLIKRNGADYNMPTQKSMELGLFEIKETTVVHADGHTSISKTPKVTGKGQLYFVNKFLGKETA